MVWLLVVAASAAGCKKAEKGGVPGAVVEANLLDSVPANLRNRIDGVIGDKVVYLGNDIETEQLVVGTGLRVVHYWKVLAPVEGDWRIATGLHGQDDEGLELEPTLMHKGHPPGKWKAGEIIRDPQTLILRDRWKSRKATLLVSLHDKDDPKKRMPVTRGPSDGHDQVVAYEFDLARGAIAPLAPTYTIEHARGEITIDGKADEADWQRAPLSPLFTSAAGGRPLTGSARARLLYDQTNLYAFIEVEDTEVFSPYSKHDDSLWKADVVELFIDADGNRKGYIELQVNPRGAHFDAWFPVNRHKPHHFEWTSKMVSKVVVHGTIDNRKDVDRGWDVEIAIPLADVKGMDADMAVSIPPQPGESWRLNVVRVDKPKDDQLGASTWSPITIRDFHALNRMLTVVFAPPAPN